MVQSIFVTGGAGYLGRYVVKRLAESASRRVVCLVRGPAPDGLPPNVRYIRGDLLDTGAYSHALTGCDVVLHMAAATGKHSPQEFRSANRDATEVLLNEARQRGVGRFLFVSSIATKFHNLFRYFYAETKQQAEKLVASSGLRWTIVRPTMILGRDAPVLAALARLAGLPVIPVFGNGSVPVQPIFVDDLADCLIGLLDENGMDGVTLEVGGPETLTIEDLMLRIRRSAGKRPAMVLHLPASLTGRCLGLMEPFLLPVLPFTAGQLASFCNPGTTAAHPWVAERQNRMLGVSAMLEASNNG
jgi:NADH dehydrogenase